MTPMFLPLVVSLAAVGMDAASFRGADDGAFASGGAGDFSSQDPVEAAIAGSSYPDAYRWHGGGDSAELRQFEVPLGQAGVASSNRNVVSFADPGDASDETFDWTNGGGMVGIGFRWRFR